MKILNYLSACFLFFYEKKVNALSESIYYNSKFNRYYGRCIFSVLLWRKTRKNVCFKNYIITVYCQWEREERGQFNPIRSHVCQFESDIFKTFTLQIINRSQFVLLDLGRKKNHNFSIHLKPFLIITRYSSCSVRQCYQILRKSHKKGFQNFPVRR